MVRKYKFCINCRRTIPEIEIQRGLYVGADRGLLCATCAQRLDEAVEAVVPKPAAPAEASEEPRRPSAEQNENAADLLSGIRQQLEAIQRILMFEKSSAWNVLGGVAQCLALGMLLTGVFRWLEDPLSLLVVALVFQVMALTFLVKGK